MEEEKMEELRREILELRQQLDRERSARMQVEDEVKESFCPRSKHLNELTSTGNKQSFVWRWLWRNLSHSRAVAAFCVARCTSMNDKLPSWIDLNCRWKQIET